MSKWLKSATQKTYAVNGKLIPACITKNNDYLEVSEGEYSEFQQKPVIASLLKNGGIVVLDNEPASHKTDASVIATTNATLQAENTRLKLELDRTTARLAMSKDSSQVQSLQDALDKANEEIKTLQDALDKANEEIKTLQDALDKANEEIQAKEEE